MYEASNPYAFLDPLRQLSASKPSLDYPLFGIPDQAEMVFEKGVAHFRSEDPDAKFYVFDPRYPANEKCDYYFVKNEAKFDLVEGKVADPLALPPPNRREKLRTVPSHGSGY